MKGIFTVDFFCYNEFSRHGFLPGLWAPHQAIALQSDLGGCGDPEQTEPWREDPGAGTGQSQHHRGGRPMQVHRVLRSKGPPLCFMPCSCCLEILNHV